MGLECGEGVSSSPLGVGSGEEAVPSPQKIFLIFYLKRRVLVYSDVLNVPVTPTRAYFHFHQYKPTSYTYNYARVTHSCRSKRKDNNEVTGKQPVTVKG